MNRKLPYRVTLFDKDGDPLSEHKFKSLIAARRQFNSYILVTSVYTNWWRITLTSGASYAHNIISEWARPASRGYYADFGEIERRLYAIGAGHDPRNHNGIYAGHNPRNHTGKYALRREIR